jgi:hypothetical protein
MVRTLIRFALVWGLSMLLRPYVNQAFDKLARRAPTGGVTEAILLELSSSYSASLITYFAETVGELVVSRKR